MFLILLLTTTSLMMDRSFLFVLQPQPHQHGSMIQSRLQCQVAMWLTVVLSSINTRNYDHQETTTNINTSTTITIMYWVHGIFFGNILSLVVESWSDYKDAYGSGRLIGWQQQRRRYGCGWSPMMRSWVRWLSPCAWWTVMITIITTRFVISPPTDANDNDDTKNKDKEDDVSKMMLQIFAASLFVVYGLEWHWQRQRLTMRNTWSSTTPTTATTATTATSGIDEQYWYTWNASQTMQWMVEALLHESSVSSLLQRNDSSNINATTTSPELDTSLSTTWGQHPHHDPHLLVWTLMGPHDMTGDLLESLTIPILVQTLHFPYASAYGLVTAIRQRLVIPYPSPRTRQRRIAMSSEEPLGFSTGTTKSSGLQKSLQQPFSSSSSASTGWLAQHDEEFNRSILAAEASTTSPLDGMSSNHSSYRPPPPTRTSAASWQPQASLTRTARPNMDPAQEQRMQDMMKEKYGLELPRIATSSTSTVAGDDDDHVPTTTSLLDRNNGHHPLASTTPLSTSAVPLASASITSKSASPPLPPSTTSSSSTVSSILNQMPSHIQEIAQRRPELVQRLLQERTLPMLATTTSTTSSPVLLPPREEEEDYEDDETTRLLSRPSPASQSASMMTASPSRRGSTATATSNGSPQYHSVDPR